MRAWECRLGSGWGKGAGKSYHFDLHPLRWPERNDLHVWLAVAALETLTEPLAAPAASSIARGDTRSFHPGPMEGAPGGRLPTANLRWRA